MNKHAFEDFIHAGNLEGSGKASSYVRALDLLAKMLGAHSFGFSDCVKIWEVDSPVRLQELYHLVRAETSKGPSSKWNLEGIPKSYLQKGYCSAALKSYQQFLNQA
jgi:putative restriction endonuclease